MIITVPNERSIITNHKVGAYDSNVLSGVNGEYSFHNVEMVYGDMEKAKKLYPKMKTQFIEGKIYTARGYSFSSFSSI